MTNSIRKKYLITGGAGFIGSNLASTLLSQGSEVTIYDDLSRKMSENNLKWLKENTGYGKLEVIINDIRNKDSLYRAIKNKDIIFHLAAQVAVTDSINNPMNDFETNTIGAMNLLEGVRRYNPNATVLYSSTNKVYGSMEYLKYRELKDRFVFLDKCFKDGINESFSLDFHSPYSCSKGSADQYFHDYSRIYGLKTVIFRQSCIYGKRQFGNEDQGWVMHFLKKILQGERIVICGNGKQVRDILYIDDLIDAYLRAVEKINIVKGNIYNIGGGKGNAISLIELIKIIERKFNKFAKYSFQEWRQGDQKVFFCDNKKVCEELAWKAKVDINKGLDKLYEWLIQII
jgi:CDP-paratose 2-epimerase